MIQLTSKTLPDFMLQLQALLGGKRFTLHSGRGTARKGCILRTLRSRTTPEGLPQVWFETRGGISQHFTACFDGVSQTPIVELADAQRTFYCFREGELEVRVDWLKTQAGFGDGVTIRITLD